MARGVPPNHVSSQNLVDIPLPTKNLTLRKNISFVLISPFQNGESVGLMVARASVFECKYLLRSIWDHMPSGSVSNLYNHLLIRHLFLISNFSIPRPPWSLGRQRISHRARRYFLLASSDCQKKRDLKKSSRFRPPFGILKNESKNIGMLVHTELIKTSRPP